MTTVLHLAPQYLTITTVLLLAPHHLFLTHDPLCDRYLVHKTPTTTVTMRPVRALTRTVQRITMEAMKFLKSLDEDETYSEILKGLAGLKVCLHPFTVSNTNIYPENQYT